MKLFNSASRQLEDFKPQVPGKVSFYSCGPTVYDYLHVGNWSSFIRWDILNRWLSNHGYSVNWYMNITDVGHLVSDADDGEDKLITGALREGKTAWQIAEYYSQDFIEGLDALNISIPKDHLVRATDYIKEQINLIAKLQEKGFTYKIDDGIYFDTSKFADYGSMAGLQLNKLKPGARVAINNQKRQPSDFALWKFSPKNSQRDMEWSSPWGKGFPGWHIECSTLAMKFLGQTIDIHAGGIDHIPVHHTNEIAQSQAATGHTFANYWLHSNFLLVNSTKISKSLSNGITLQDLSKMNFNPLDFRLLVLQSHYQSEANFSFELMEAARNRYNTFKQAAAMIWQPNSKAQNWIEPKEVTAKISFAMNNNLNTPLAIAEVGQFFDQVIDKTVNPKQTDKLNDLLLYFDKIFGLNLASVPNINSKQQKMLQDRLNARTASNWKLADQIRAELAEQSIKINDHQDGQFWYYVSD